MAVIETLSVAFTARTTQFTKGVAGIEKRLNAFAARASSLGTTALIGLGTAAAGAAAGITALARPQFEAIDNAAKLSDSLGISTEALVGFQHAADLSGVSQEALAKGLQRFEKTIADAGAGLSTAKRALDNLGLDSARVAALSVDQALALVADRLPNMTNAFQRTQTALDLFGRTGLGMVNMLGEGSKGLREAQKEAERLGLSFSRVEAKQVEAANDAVSRLRSAFAGVGRTIAIETAPIITAFTERIVNTGFIGERMGMAIVTAMEKAALGIAQAMNATRLLGATWHAATAIITTSAGLVLKSLEAVAMAIEKMAALQPRFMAWAKKGPAWMIPGGSVIFDLADQLGKRMNGQVESVAGQVRGIAGTLADAFLDTGIEAAMKAMNDFDRFAYSIDATSAKVKSFFDDIRNRAGLMQPGARGSSPLAELVASRKVDAFGARAIDLGSVFVGALNSSKRQEQSTKDSGMHELQRRTNTLLARLANGSVAVTA